MHVNPNVAVIAALNQNAAITGAVAGRVYSPRLVDGYKPDVDGPAISLFVRGGKLSLYNPIAEPSLQVTTWGITSKIAASTMAAVLGVLHDLQDQVIATVDGNVRLLAGVCEVYPQDVIDSDTGWNTCVAFFRVSMYDSGENVTISPPFGPPISTLPAGVVLSAFTVAAVQGNFFVNADVNTPGLVAVGLVDGGALAGASVNIQYEGPITNVGWNWALNLPVFVGANGALTQTPPTSGYMQVLGYPLSPTTLLIDIEEPIYF